MIYICRKFPEEITIKGGDEITLRWHSRRPYNVYTYRIYIYTPYFLFLDFFEDRIHSKILK